MGNRRPNIVPYAEVQKQAKEDGLVHLDTWLLVEPTELNGYLAVVKAKVSNYEGTRTASGIGDAAPKESPSTKPTDPVATSTVRMAECVPLGSEILTEQGWKRYDELEIGETVFAYDTESDLVKRVPLLDVSAFDAAPVVSVKGRSIDVMCTPDHKWAVTSQNWPRSKLQRTDSFRAGESLVVAAPAESGTLRMDERDAAILGWLATDGSVRNDVFVDDQYGRWGPYTRAHLDQSKPQYVEEIRELLGEDASESSAQHEPRQMPSGQVSTFRKAYRWSLKTGAVKRILGSVGWTSWSDLPGIVLRLDQKSRAVMLDAMLKGDGSKKTRSNTWTFGKKRKPGVMEAFELLATLEGRAMGGLSFREQPGGSGPMPQRNVRVNRTLKASYLRIQEEGAAKVWCPTTELGTWIMRQNGYITITGNTRAKGRAMKEYNGTADPTEEEMPPESDREGSQAATRSGKSDSPMGTPSGGSEGRHEASSSQSAESEGNSQTSADRASNQDRLRLAELIGLAGRSSEKFEQKYGAMSDIGSELCKRWIAALEEEIAQKKTEDANG